MKKTPGNPRYAMLFVKKGKNEKFKNTKYLPLNQHLLNKKILCASFVENSMSSCMQQVYQALNPLEYSWELIDGVHVPAWYNSLQLPTQEEISQHQEKNYENPTANNFEKEKCDGDNDMVSGVKFNDDSDI